MWGVCPLLMLFAIKVIDGLHGIERFEGYFHEHGAPVAHCAVPKSGQFKCLEFLAVLALVGDEACLRIHVVGQMEGLAVMVLDGADEVNGVEVGSLFEHGFLFSVVHIDL